MQRGVSKFGDKGIFLIWVPTVCTVGLDRIAQEAQLLPVQLAVRHLFGIGVQRSVQSTDSQAGALQRRDLPTLRHTPQNC